MVAVRRRPTWSGVRIYVEGGGETRAQQMPLRIGFTQLFARHLGDLPRPRVIACGGRSTAYEDFVNGVAANPDDLCILLVDSEGPVRPEAEPWGHVARRRGDQWQRPAGIDQDQLHFMVEAMEAWIVVDPDALATFYRHGFEPTALPKRKSSEDVPKKDLFGALESATRLTKRGVYRKDHGFELVGTVDPVKIIQRCPRYGARFFAQLTAVMTQFANRRPTK